MTVRALYTDQELLAKIAIGDHRAFRVVYDRHYHHLYAFVLKILKSNTLAEEIIQEVFLKLWTQGSKVTAINHVESYLVTIARNRCYDELRRNKLRAHINLEDLGSEYEAHNETEESIYLNDTRRVIEDAIDKLPPQQRSVYRLCHVEGYKYDEAAKELNLSVDTVQSYMKLALRNLRQQLSQNTDLLIVLVLLKII